MRLIHRSKPQTIGDLLKTNEISLAWFVRRDKDEYRGRRIEAEGLGNRLFVWSICVIWRSSSLNGVIL